ncbi:hypothetical protein C462_15809 [Halorubrum distributum JCM 13916]|uniref:Uncharacterized protein n=1 Tax=Halorubrum distributum JCM 13916 TaxID=1230455 RepID=M0PB65_9EURY|nr:hypothetical protein C462_15809 [Halorubrum arcis JCM 13916]
MSHVHQYFALDLCFFSSIEVVEKLIIYTSRDIRRFLTRIVSTDHVPLVKLLTQYLFCFARQGSKRTQSVP